MYLKFWQNCFKQDSSVLQILHILFFVINSFNNPGNQLDMLNKLVSDCLNRHAALKRTKYTKPRARWMKEREIAVQNKHDKNRLLEHNSPSKEKWNNYPVFYKQHFYNQRQGEISKRSSQS